MDQIERVVIAAVKLGKATNKLAKLFKRLQLQPNSLSIKEQRHLSGIEKHVDGLAFKLDAILQE